MTFALTNDKSRAFTDYNDKHICMVIDKTRNLTKNINKLLIQNTHNSNYIPFSHNVLQKIILATAIAHHTGMDALGYAFCNDSNSNYIKEKNRYYKMKLLNPNNYSEIRIHHGLNSALKVLEKRNHLKLLDYSDLEIDQIAIICMSHFISTSGITDINNQHDWIECFNRIDSAIYAYNTINPNSKIFFYKDF